MQFIALLDTLDDALNEALGRTLRSAFSNPYYHDNFPRDNRHYVCIHQDGEVFAGCQISTFEGGSFISAFGVAKKHQGKGYGRVLMEAIIQEHYGSGVITLRVAKDNEPALKLYKSCGFVVSRDSGFEEMTMTRMPT